MKKRNLYGVFMIVLAVLLLGGIFATAFTYDKEELRALTVVGVIVAILSFIGTMILFKLSTSPDPAWVEKWNGYRSLPREKVSDFAAELKETRAKYEADTDPDKNKPMIKFQKNPPNIHRDGKIYYGYIVEANSMLFKQQNFSTLAMPAVVAYSPDEYYEKDPYALEEIAGELYMNRKNNILANELKYFYNEEFSDANGRKIYVSTIFIYRPHVPDGYLCGSMFPILADTSSRKKECVATLDSKYWTDKLVVNFLAHDASSDVSPEPEPIDVFGV